MNYGYLALWLVNQLIEATKMLKKTIQRIRSIRLAIFSRLGLKIVVNISLHMVFCLPLNPSKAQTEGDI